MSVDSNTPSEPDKRVSARDYYEWYLAYVEAGFTEAQAMAILTRPAVNYTVNSSYPPELYEFWERQNAAALAVTDELNDD